MKFSLLFIGMDVGMPAGLASLVLQAQALFTVVLAALLLGERIAGSQVLGLAVAFGGLVLVAGGLDGAATAEGFALVIAAAVAWGFGNLALKRAAPADPLRFMTTVCVVPPLPLLALSLAFEGPAEIGGALAHADALGIAAVLYLAFAATTVGWGLWGGLMARYPASTVAPFSLLVPVFGLSFGALLLGEPVTGRDIAAAGLILGGVLLTLRAPRLAISPLVADSSPRRGLHPRDRHEKVPADAEVRDAESEAIEVRGPPPRDRRLRPPEEGSSSGSLRVPFRSSALRGAFFVPGRESSQIGR